LVTALDRYYDYLLFSNTSPDGSTDSNAIKLGIYGLIDEVNSLLTDGGNLRSDVNYDEISLFLFRLVKAWREYFIKYMDVARVLRVEEGRFRMPEEARRKIGETVSKAIEKEVKRPK
jgi:hypothetical protein